MDIEINENEALEALNELGLPFELIEEYYPRIFEPLGKPSQLKLTHREFFYWTDKGVIDITKSDDGQSPWSRLNLIEVLWIRIVKELREFNLPFASIVKLKREMFGSILQLMRNDKEATLDFVKDSSDNPSVLNFYNLLLKSSQFEANALEKLNKHIDCLLTALVAQILLFKRDVQLVIYRDSGDFQFMFDGFKDQERVQNEIDQAKSGTHLIINLRKIVAEYLVEPGLEQLNEEFGFVTEDEKALIKVIRDKKVKEIHIKKDDNEVLTYTATSKKEIRDDQVQVIKKLLRMNEFDDVRVVLRNDKHIYIENKKKVKIRPVDTVQKK
jgi:hypothetical protein